jgi:hypothetical protein
LFSILAASVALLNEHSQIIARRELLFESIFPKSFVELSGLSGLLMLGYVYCFTQNFLLYSSNLSSCKAKFVSVQISTLLNYENFWRSEEELRLVTQHCGDH